MPVDVAAFLKTHCVRCHGAKEPEGAFRLDDLAGDVSQEAERWRAIHRQLQSGLMPPDDQPRPAASQIENTLRWIGSHVRLAAAPLPNQGNLLPHEVLFGTKAKPGAVPPPRVWRLSPEAYLGFVKDVHRGRADGIVQPFTLTGERGIRDFSGLYAIDEPSTEILVRNAELIVAGQLAHEVRDGKVQMKNDTVGEFRPLIQPDEPPTSKQLRTAIDKQFTLATGRPAKSEELEQFEAFYEKCRKTGTHVSAGKTTLMAVLLRANAIYRQELGGLPTDAGRRLLAPDELVRSLSLAVGYRRNERLAVAASKGELATREQIAAVVRELLFTPDKKTDQSRLLGFFQEYFDYTKAPLIFKENKFPFPEHANEWSTRKGNWDKKETQPRGSVHRPTELVADTDKLILHILSEDRDVFRRLLTTDLTFTNIRYKEDKKTRTNTVPSKAIELNPNNDRGMVGPHYVYGFAPDAWPEQQPAKIPSDKPRLGILMQPAWLVAHSTNFDNDPVRRGRWVRERLLGGTVPEIPIGVAAQVPDEPHHTFRDRLQVTRDARCWKCHQHMDELGLPFEQFDHYGVHRTREIVVDPAATEKNVDKKGQPLGKQYQAVALNTTGAIDRSGDAKLDGPVRDPYEYVHRLANSDRTRQVFIRHVFRYFLGRNETQEDAFTLQEADAAYLASGGSFKTLLLSLLTSEAFLYRRHE